MEQRGTDDFVRGGEPRTARETRDAITDVWGPRTPYVGEWPTRVDERTVAPPEKWFASSCVLCSNGCGVEIGVKGGQIVGIRGRADDPVNRGRLGPKGLHGWIANASADRLTQPLVRRHGRLEPATWDEAMGEIVRRTKSIVRKSTSSAVGFYTSGQLFLEEYYTLAVIGKAGLGTPHMDGNTRLCTATAARALLESFGSDGQPGSYADFDTTDALLLVGHNVASQQTVLWSRILDRKAGPRPPAIVVVDPRRTETAKAAVVHLAPRVGTNLALLNGLLHVVIRSGNVDRAFVDEHVVGFEHLERVVSRYTPAKVSEITGVPAARLEAAAEIVGSSPTLVSTCLQGVYQSRQATASAIQVNNLHLIRGMIGKPGCSVFQMNGQPTSQNTRECGADGELPGFRNWENRAHQEELARIWNVDVARLPFWAPPTHAMQIFRHVEEGSIRMLWVSATNPLVSLPELGRARRTLGKSGLFLVVQDAFLTETAQVADVVLPAAIWGEKTGTFTNTERSVHLSEKAVEPPGEARSDLEIFLDFARRMDFRDKHGKPLVKWTDAEGAFEAWKECSRGRPCDYSGLSYAKLRQRSGVRWPVTERAPDGTERLYTDGRFPTRADECSTFGVDLLTGAVVREDEYRSRDPMGKAVLKAAEHEPPHEPTDERYPFVFTSGRVVHQFHTRTKTGRAPALQAAAPDVFVQISEEDARALEIRTGDPVEVTSRRGRLVGPARVGEIEPGHVFAPFHYGSAAIGSGHDGDRPRAANELTIAEWDPASKQPLVKYAAVALRKLATLDDPPLERVLDVVRESAARVADTLRFVAGVVRGKRAHVADYLGLASGSSRNVAEAFETVAKRHGEQPDVSNECRLFAGWSRAHVEGLARIEKRHGERESEEPSRLRAALLDRGRSGGFGLLQDLHDLWLLAHEVHVCWVVLSQAARALRDDELERTVTAAAGETNRQIAWLRTRVEQAAPQALVVPS